MTCATLVDYSNMSMRYHPRYIVFWAVSRYMTDAQIESFRNDIGRSSRAGIKQFTAAFSKHIDLEILLHAPQIREDAWIYNYLKYDCNTRFKRSKLISRYEREIVLPVEKKFRELIAGLE